MSDDIFLLQGEDDLVAMSQMPYEAESVLQELLGKFPTVLTGGREAAQWLLVSREVPIAGESGEAASGYLDHLFLDQDGVPTLVEVKRSSDTRLRREVVGQMLDYAANAVAYLPGERLRELFVRRCELEGLNPDAEISAHLGPDDEADEFWERAGVNLKAGRIRLVFVADEIPVSLQRIVEFMNEQMAETELLAIEVKQYVGAGLRTLVPRVIGETAAVLTRKSRAERQWDESSFFAELTLKRGSEEARAARELFEWARRQMLRSAWGKGRVDGSFVPVLDHDGKSHFPLAIYTYGRAEIQFQWLTRPPFDDMDFRREFLSRLNEISGLSFPEDAITRRPSISLSLLASDPEALVGLERVLDWFCDTVRNETLGQQQERGAGRVPFESEVTARIDAVFEAHPELPDQRTQHPWATGCLGDPLAPVWFIAENPSLGQVEKMAEATSETQWAVSPGDKLFREMLVRHGFKRGTVDSPGGWCCYITNVIKSAHRAEQWKREPVSFRREVAEAWAPVLRWEFENGRPEIVVSLGGEADRLLDHLIARGLVPPLAERKQIAHYSYIGSRADAKRRLGPKHPTRLAEWNAEFDAIASARDVLSGASP